MSGDGLSSKVKSSIAFNAAIQLIPYVGGPISSVWSSYKQELINKRVEEFHAKVIADIEELKNVHVSSEVDPERLEDLISKVYEKVESESSGSKVELLRRFLKSALKNPPTNDYDERLVFLNDLSSMSDLECWVLSVLANHGPVIVGGLRVEGISPYAFVGAVERLRGRGFIVSLRVNFVSNGGADEILSSQVSISDYGNKFVKHCLE